MTPSMVSIHLCGGDLGGSGGGQLSSQLVALCPMVWLAVDPRSEHLGTLAALDGNGYTALPQPMIRTCSYRLLLYL